MTQGIFVGHHDRTGAVLCNTKNGVARGKSWTKTDTERCLGIDELGSFVWHSVADGGSRIDEEGHSRQQQTEEMLQQTAGALRQSQQQAAAAATVAASQSAWSKGMSTVDMMLLGKFERWNGEDKSWKDWLFITRACLTAAPCTISSKSRERGSPKMKPDAVESCITC